MTDKSINVLGEVYGIIYGTKDKFPALEMVDGYTDTSIRLIVVDEEKPDAVDAKDDYDEYMRSVVRHEITHAFLYESGLNVNSAGCESWATNEEMVDWFAIQSPKLFRAFKEAGVMGGEC